MAIIQWNIRGFHSNRLDLNILTHLYNRDIFCLQESHFQSNPPSIRGFNAYNKPYTPNTTAGGVSIFVKTSIPQSELNLNTTLQAQAVRVTLQRSFTICNIYLPPRSNPTTVEINDLINRLPKPLLFLGDFNAHSPLWGNNTTDAKGKLVESALDHHNLTL